jgi:multidrug efflux pump subunit AcrA (membrane-fusion protein)
VLTVPSSAVKSNSTGSYVEMFDTPLVVDTTAGNTGTASATAPKKIPVEVGISDDTNTEITGGLKEGDQIVTRTITATTTAKATSSTPSLLGGGNTRGGAALGR